MSETLSDHVIAPDHLAAARELIRREGGCVVGIDQVLDELSDKFGDLFTISPDMEKLLDLISSLWDDPYIGRVQPSDQIEFVGTIGVPMNMPQVPPPIPFGQVIANENDIPFEKERQSAKRGGANAEV